MKPTATFNSGHGKRFQTALGAVALLIVGLSGTWALQPSRAVADDSAAVIAAAESPEEIQQLLTSDREGTVIEQVGLPDNPHGVRFRFSDSQVVIGGCIQSGMGNRYNIEWTQDGFSIINRWQLEPGTPIRPVACAIPALLPQAEFRPGLAVSIESTSDGTIELTSSEWSVTLDIVQQST